MFTHVSTPFRSRVFGPRCDGCADREAELRRRYVFAFFLLYSLRLEPIAISRPDPFLLGMFFKIPSYMFTFFK